MKRVFHLHVAGVTHRNADGSKRQEIVRHCDIGELLQLVPEPDNRYDPKAMKVCRLNGEQLGYIGQPDNFHMPKHCRVYLDGIGSPDGRPRIMGARLRIEVD